LLPIESASKNALFHEVAGAFAIVTLGLSLLCCRRRYRKERDGHRNCQNYHEPTFHGLPPRHGLSLLYLHSAKESNWEANDPEKTQECHLDWRDDIELLIPFVKEILVAV
jgi:hypothetical protein